MKWRIAHKLTIASVFMILLTLLAGGVGLWQVMSIGQALIEAQQVAQQRAWALEMRTSGMELVTAMDHLLRTEDSNLIRAEVMPALDDLGNNLQSLQDSDTDWKATALLREMQQTHDELSLAVDNVALLANENRWTEMPVLMEGQLRPAQERLNLYFDWLVYEINLHAEKVSLLAEQTVRQAAILLAALLILTTAVAVGWRQIVFRQIGKSIALLRQGVARISGGELGYELEIRTGDEIEELADEFNDMAHSLQVSQARLEMWGHELEKSVVERTRELQEALEEQRRLSTAIREMSTPVVPVHSGVIVMPLVGVIDAARAQQIVAGLLEGVENQNARVAIIDVTGIPVMSDEVVSYLMQAAQAVRLLGAQVVLVGITPEVAKTIIDLGVDLAAGLVTRSDLQAGIEYALGTMSLHVTTNGA